MGIKEVDFGFDDFGKPKVLTAADSIANLLINILFLKPGQIPSQPYLGININQYLYSFSDETIDSATLRTMLTDQAPYLLQYIDMANLQVNTITDERGQGILYIFAPLLIDSNMIAIGIKQSTDANTSPFNYKIIDTNTIS